MSQSGSPSFANDGQDEPLAGQVASLTSTNNFINFCAGQTIHQGVQNSTGTCNPAPMGMLVASDVIPTSKFVFPKHNSTIPSNGTFTVRLAVANLNTGNFANEDENFLSAPQQVNGEGAVLGHATIVIEALDSLGQTTPTDPRLFAFWRTLSAQRSGDELSGDVTNGLPAGFYRLSSVIIASNYQPVLVSIEQHGAINDAIYFTVSDTANTTTSSAPPTHTSTSSSSPSRPAQTGASRNHHNNRTNMAAISGGVAGSIVFLGIIIGILLGRRQWRRRRSYRRKLALDLMAESPGSSSANIELPMTAIEPFRDAGGVQGSSSTVQLVRKSNRTQSSPAVNDASGAGTSELPPPAYSQIVEEARHIVEGAQESRPPPVPRKNRVRPAP
ncbi:hypothetical protein PUNSTDRAFT_127435 [Punctularia strigosozonata HHB-11173 SS5]|uniref:uncharacterized protein n=1 Tax=Punctularia strigosozonata (strain HHB-11173) TaxID=741275 RepID=UPI0004417F21|nr:uncharacterized protein PUNSTDRAFT_127435 [Punctularia strigosozonata HHB-11173 SS5]EIN06846.1 hypothetical protein PUNSTDRAFT_127435 [Punctularia strigosozonata HHB-11173 SS5]